MTEASERFAEALGALSPSQFRAFVADLWRARGRTVRTEGEHVVVTDGPQCRLRPLAASEHRPICPSVDLVVTAEPIRFRGGSGVEHVGPSTLCDLIRYAIDETDAKRLRQQYRVPRSGDDATARSSGDGCRTITTDPALAEPPSPGADPHTDRRQFILATGAFVAGVASVAALGSDDAEAPERNRSSSTPAEPIAVRPWPPGVSADGVTDVDRLLHAHSARLADSSYTLATTRTVHSAGGEVRSTLGVRVALGDTRTFIADIATGGPSGRLLFGERPAIAQLWSPGDRLFRRFTVDGVTEYDEFAIGAEVGGAFYWANVFPFGGRWESTTEFIRWVLGKAEPSVAIQDPSPQSPVSVFASRTDLPAIPAGPSDRATVALESLMGSITNAGLVRSLRLGLGWGGGDPRQVTWSVDYRNVGDTTVERPAWLDTFLIDDVLI